MARARGRSRRRKRRGGEITVPLASMGDIAFLLIIFFIVAANFIKEPQRALTLPQATALDPIEQTVHSVVIDEERALYLDGRRMPNAKAIEAELAPFLKGKTDERSRIVSLRVDREIEKAVFEPVIDAIVKANGVIGFIGEDLAAAGATGEDAAPADQEQN